MLRPLVASFTCLAFTLQLGGCSTPYTTTVPPESLQFVEYKWIVGVTTDSGETVEFDPVPAKTSKRSAKQPTETKSSKPRRTHTEVRNDTLFAVVNAVPRSFALGNIQHVFVRQSKSNQAGTAVAAVVLGAAAMFGALVLAASQASCPMVYSWDGEQYVFTAEPFAGAVSRGLERDDIAELEHLKPVDGLYRLRVTNEMDESDFVNHMQLRVVDHPAGARVAVDANGNVHTILAPVPPSQATDADGRDVRLWLEATDRRLWEPLPEEGDTRARQEIVMTFPKPAGAANVNLIANVQTGTLGARMIGEMLALRGNELPWFYSTLDHNAAVRDSLLAWNLREELFILQVEVEERDGWRVRGQLPGEAMAPENVVVPLDIGGVDGDELRIRIRPPIGFWALNSFAADYGPQQPLHVQHVHPNHARDKSGQDVLPALLAADDAYVSLPQTGDWAEVTFPAPQATPGQQRTVFLHSRGYYVLHLPTDRAPDLEALDRIATVPDAAARFAHERFREWQTQLATQRGAAK